MNNCTPNFFSRLCRSLQGSSSQTPVKNKPSTQEPSLTCIVSSTKPAALNRSRPLFLLRRRVQTETVGSRLGDFGDSVPTDLRHFVSSMDGHEELYGRTSDRVDYENRK